ncbi:MAG: AraC family transcriptional regulator ligand-binding domain-containing protein [SAR324 cluster bacterium]|nr:AraC family transcriptional regulator ligand-binding domain-containing protein [SAR324 cluster bacterium]
MGSFKEKRVSTEITILVIRYLENLKFNLSDLAEKTKASYALFTEPDHKIPIKYELALWDYAAQKTGDAHVGISMAHLVDLKSFGVIGYLSLQQATLFKMLESYCHYHRLVHEEAILKPVCGDEDDRIEHHFSIPGEGPGQAANEFTMASIWLTLKNSAIRPITLKAVAFQHSKPDSIERYQEIFGRIEKFEFSQPSNLLVFPAQTLETPTRQSDSQLGNLLKTYADQALASLPDSNELESSLYRVISELMPESNLNIDAAAGRMGMSRRTLQRRLSEKKLTFSSLVEEVQKRYSLRYLEDPSMNITEVAYLCGFSELSPFSRAFKRWTGMSPKEFRSV